MKPEIYFCTLSHTIAPLMTQAPAAPACRIFKVSAARMPPMAYTESKRFCIPFRESKPASGQPPFAVGIKDVACGDVGAANPLGLNRVFHGMAGSAEHGKTCFFFVRKTPEDGQRQVQGVAIQLCRNICKIVENAGSSVFLTDCEHAAASFLYSFSLKSFSRRTMPAGCAEAILQMRARKSSSQSFRLVTHKISDIQIIIQNGL